MMTSCPKTRQMAPLKQHFTNCYQNQEIIKIHALRRRHFPLNEEEIILLLKLRYDCNIILF